MCDKEVYFIQTPDTSYLNVGYHKISTPSEMQLKEICPIPKLMKTVSPGETVNLDCIGTLKGPTDVFTCRK